MIELYKGNELHMLLVDNVNVKSMNNADMQMSYINKTKNFQRLENKMREIFIFSLQLSWLGLLLEYGVDSHC